MLYQACALLTSNVPPAFAHLYKVATRPQDAPKPADLATRVRTAALIREAALKSAIFVGVPRVRPISSLLLVKDGKLMATPITGYSFACSFSWYA